MVYFVCLHGSAKSLIASEYFNRMASARQLLVESKSVGVEPDAEVPGPVVAGLARDGIDVRSYRPGSLDEAALHQAAQVVSFGCEVPDGLAGGSLERWDDLPMVSDGFERARDAIVVRVSRLVERLANTKGE
jgi:arsenate reductase